MVHALTIEIGGVPIIVRTGHTEFAQMLRDRYGEFVTGCSSHAATGLDQAGSVSGVERREFVLDVELIPPGPVSNAEDVSVRREGCLWIMERGDFRAEWDFATHRGWVRQSANPYAIDGVLRILHSLTLAGKGGFLLHAASAVRNGRAFVFAGVSGAGKTTISRLAPPDATLLTDEISYVLKAPDPALGAQSAGAIYQAFGTPFAGELAKIGTKVQAPLAGVFLLKQGPENRIEPVSEAEAVRELMRHILFFARDEELVQLIFETVCHFVKHVPVRRLVFLPDARVWELVR